MSKLNNWFINRRIVHKTVDSIYDDEYFKFPNNSIKGCNCYDIRHFDIDDYITKNYFEAGYLDGGGYGYGIGDFSCSCDGSSD